MIHRGLLDKENSFFPQITDLWLVDLFVSTVLLYSYLDHPRTMKELLGADYTVIYPSLSHVLKQKGPNIQLMKSLSFQ